MRRRHPLVLPVLVALIAVCWVLTRSTERPSSARHASPSAPAHAVDEDSPPLRSDTPADIGTEPARSEAEVTSSGSAGIEPREASFVRGRVVDGKERAIADAEITIDYLPGDDFNILDLEYSNDEIPVGGTQTDARGEFAMAVPEDRPLRVHARAAGFSRALLPDVFAGANLTIVLGPSATLLGRITRALDGSPVEGVDFSLSLASGPILATATSSADGSYRLSELTAGVITLRIQSHWLADPEWTELVLPAGSTVEHDVALEEGVAIHGTVSDARTNAPIAGAEIGAGWTFRRSVRTDPRGEYELPGFGEPGVYEIHARAPGYADARHEFPWTSMPTERTRLDFSLLPANRARGRVVDPEGAPFEGAYVAAVGIVGPGAATDWKSARTDSLGGFVIDSLTPGRRHALFLRASGWANLVYVFPAEELESEDVDLGTIALRRPGSIEGLVVTENGDAISGARVSLKGTNADAGARAGLDAGDLPELPRNVVLRAIEADSAGRFRFGDLPASVFEISARRPSGQASAVDSIGIYEGERRTDVRIVFPAGGAIRGRVETPDGRAVAGLTVVAIAEGREEPRIPRRPQGVTQLDGSFGIDGLDAESYTLTVDPRKSDIPSDQTFAFTHFTNARPGEEVVIVPAEQDTITGFAFTAEGTPAPDAWVTAKLDAGQIDLAASNEEGRFELIVPHGCLIQILALRMQKSDDELGYEVRKDIHPIHLANVPAGTSDLVLRFEVR